MYTSWGWGSVMEVKIGTLWNHYNRKSAISIGRSVPIGYHNINRNCRQLKCEWALFGMRPHSVLHQAVNQAWTNKIKIYIKSKNKEKMKNENDSICSWHCHITKRLQPGGRPSPQGSAILQYLIFVYPILICTFLKQFSSIYSQNTCHSLSILHMQ